MGESVQGTGRTAIPLLCAWCGRVRVGTTWAQDRRRAGADLYSHGICPGCRATHFLEAISQTTREKI